MIFGLFSVTALAEEETQTISSGTLTVEALEGTASASGVGLKITGSDGSTVTGTTNSNGVCSKTLPYGTYTVEVSTLPSGYLLVTYDEDGTMKTVSDLSDSAVTVTIDESSDAVITRYFVRKETANKTVQVLVEDLDHNGFSGVEVEISKKGSSSALAQGATNKKGVFSTVLSNGDYSYEVSNLPDGYQLVELDSSGNPVKFLDEDEADGTFTLTSSMDGYGITITLVKEGEYKEVEISVLTYGHKNQGVQGARINIVKSGKTENLVSQLTDSDGKITALLPEGTYTYSVSYLPDGYTLVHLDSSGKADRTVSLKDSSDTMTLSSNVKTFSANYTAKLDSEYKSFQLKLETLAGHPVEGAKITLAKGNSGSAYASGTTDSSGSYFTLVEPGTYQFTVTGLPEGYKIANVDANGKVTSTVEEKNAAWSVTFTKTGTDFSDTYKVQTNTEENKNNGGTVTSDDPCAAYTDVIRSKWYHEAVDYAILNQIMVGSGTKFMPNGEVTRAMVVQVLYAAEGKPGIGQYSPFTDVPKTKYYADAVAWAYDNGIAAGYTATEFRPTKAVTRQELVTFLKAYADYLNMDLTASADLSVYSDANEISAYAVDTVRWAVTKGLMTGRSATKLAPKGTTTRAEFAQIMMNFEELRG